MTEIGSASIPRVAPKARLQWDEVRGRHVLLYPEGLVALNATGAEILGLCDGARRFEEIVGALRERYPEGRTTLEQDVTAFLEAMAAKGLVTWY